MDFEINNHGSVCILVPRTEAATAWVEEHIPADAQRWGGGIAVEPRCLPDIVDGAAADGLTFNI